MRPLLLASFVITVTCTSAQWGGWGGHTNNDTIIADPEWTLVNGDASWDRRAGLQVLRKWGRFYLMGGRTAISPNISPVPGASQIWGDVWKSNNNGNTWNRILATDDASHWPARAYFQAVRKGAWMYVIGGQNYNVIPNPAPGGPPFISTSAFFNDVWRSRNGVLWYQMTDSAAWAGRAGHSAVEFKGKLYVMGGSYNDDQAIIGGPPARVYLNDVWRSTNGSSWQLVTDSADWEPRAGGQLVVKDGYMYMIGGENGFLCEPFPFCELPYFNDVWRTSNGADWELVTDSADWSPRPGHQVAVYKNKFILFGGFGLPVNPMDVWASNDGEEWTQIDAAPWNAFSPTQIKYDFDTYVKKSFFSPQVIYTFGGDRETFDFADTTNYLNVDNDVWKFDPGIAGPNWRSGPAGLDEDEIVPSDLQLLAYPDPFERSIRITFELFDDARVQLDVFNALGQHMASLANAVMPEGTQSFDWGGVDQEGKPVPAGMYLYRLVVDGELHTGKLMKQYNE